MAGMKFPRLFFRLSKLHCPMKADPTSSGNALNLSCLFAPIFFLGLITCSHSLALGEDSVPKVAGSGLAVVTALEDVLSNVIAESSISVVPIAIFRAGGVAETKRVIGGRGFRVKDPESVPPLDAVPDAYGTGVVVSDGGFILTNQHVIQGPVTSMRIFIRVPDRPLWDEVRIKASDPYSDLAILEGVAPEFSTRKWRAMPLGDGSKARKGQIVLTLGNPFAIARDGQVSAGWGIISNLRRKLPPVRGPAKTPSRPSMHHLGTLIQTDAKLNLGTSGGPLMNLKGEMIGLTTSLAAIEGHERAAGYAIAVDKAFRRAMGLLMEGREVEYGFMGIRPGELKESERAAGRRGVRVQSVVNGGPAVGHVRRMDVVTHIDGTPVDSLDGLLLAIGCSPAHQEIQLRVLRNGDPLNVPVKLTKNRIWGDSIATVKASPWRGLRVDHPAAMRPFSDVWQIPTECVVVREVLKGSPADEAGIRTGMQIHRLEDFPVNSVSTFDQVSAGLSGTVRVEVRDLRGGPPEFFRIK